ncbi:MAG: Spy/CpxP family protein refolding chaperone [Candidatus Binatia bacterium]
MVIAFALVLLPLQVLAQPMPEGPALERARISLVLRIADALKLDEAEALKVGGVIRQSDEHRSKLMEERQALEEKLREALDKQPPDASQLNSLITQGNEIDQKLALVPEDSVHELQKILTSEQQAKLMLFRHELQGEMRRATELRRTTPSSTSPKIKQKPRAPFE